MANISGRKAALSEQASADRMPLNNSLVCHIGTLVAIGVFAVGGGHRVQVSGFMKGSQVLKHHFCAHTPNL